MNISWWQTTPEIESLLVPVQHLDLTGDIRMEILKSPWGPGSPKLFIWWIGNLASRFNMIQPLSTFSHLLENLPWPLGLTDWSTEPRNDLPTHILTHLELAELGKLNKQIRKRKENHTWLWWLRCWLRRMLGRFDCIWVHWEKDPLIQYSCSIRLADFLTGITESRVLLS